MLLNATGLAVGFGLPLLVVALARMRLMHLQSVDQSHLDTCGVCVTCPFSGPGDVPAPWVAVSTCTVCPPVPCVTMYRPRPPVPCVAWYRLSLCVMPHRAPTPLL